MTAPPLPKIVNTCPPVAIKDNAAWTFVEVDTLGYKLARFIFALGATDIAMAVIPKITESNTSGSGYADITGAVLSAAPSATDDNRVYVIDVKLEGRKRYLLPAATAGDGSTGTYLSAICELYYAEYDALPIPEASAGIGVKEHVSA